MSDIGRKDAFQHALRTLAHPFSLFSMVVLFFNDYYLRIAHPSWLTGKLGDFAWLFFFPIFLTALLVWVLPRKWLKGTTPILIGISVTALVFTLGKAVPVVLGLMIDSLEWIFRREFTSVADPTDLIALPVMGLTFLLWKNCTVRKPVYNPQWKYLLIVAAGLLTMGNMAMQPSGIDYVGVKDESLYVQDNFGVYKAVDGGLGWEMVDTNDQIRDYGFNDWQPEPIQQITDPENDNIQYKFITGESVQRSIDQGDTWVTEFEFNKESEAVEAHYQRGLQTGYNHDIPRDADFDPETGNLIMAMSFDGVLIRTSAGEYHWVAISSYSHQEIDLMMILNLLLPTDIAFALFLAVVSMAFLCWRNSNWVWKVFLILLLAGVLFVGFAFQPARYFTGYMTFPLILSVIVGGITALILFILTLIKTKANPHIILTALIVCFLHVVPLILWGYNIIPWYPLAFGIGVLLSAGWTVFSYLRYAKLRKSVTEEDM